jgi:hypothetical protein
VKVIPNNLLRRWSGASQDDSKRRPLLKLLQGSYQQGQGYMEGVALRLQGSKLILFRRSMWS